MKKNALIIGAGGVASVAAHKCAQNNDILGDICIASRTVQKCKDIIEKVHRKENLKDKSGKLYAKQLDASKIELVAELINDTNSEIVINVGTAFVNMPIMDACLEAGVAYIELIRSRFFREGL